MEKQTQEKMESLMKYVPFIDFILDIDKQKYIKFINIRKWIILKKKKYPLSDLNKIEQSIITQYKNLLIEDNVQIPQNITNIFAPMNFKQYVNLCSDEEEDEVQEVHKKKADATNTKQHKKRKRKEKHKAKKVYDSDNDLEIVSVDFVERKEKKIDSQGKADSTTTSKVAFKQDEDFDEVSKDLLSKIDKLAEDDMKMKSLVHEPVNYTYQAKDYCDITEDKCGDSGEGPIYQRRSNSDVLFKRRGDFKGEVTEVHQLENRQKSKKITDLKDVEVKLQPLEKNVKSMLHANKRGEFKGEVTELHQHENRQKSKKITDFKDDEVEVQTLENNVKSMLYAKNPIEIISLDSCSDSESGNVDERPTTSKAAAIKSGLGKQADDQNNSTMKDDAKTSEDKHSNLNCNNKKTEQLCNSIESVLLDMNEFMDELKDPKVATKTCQTNDSILAEKVTLVESSCDKENFIKPTNAPNSCDTTHNLNQEEISKLLEDISNNKDFDMDTFYAALSCVKQMNTNPPSTPSRARTDVNHSSQGAPADTPPPAPPPIGNNLSTPPHHMHSFQQQQQQAPHAYPAHQPSNAYYPPQQPPLTSHYSQNATYVPTPGMAALPPRPKVNINDPRIIKQLQAIQNSPLFTYNVLNPETAASIMQICQSQKFNLNLQQTHQSQQQHHTNQPHTANSSSSSSSNNNAVPNSTGSPSTNFRKSSDTVASSNSITYGEYKRRQLDQKLRQERQREEERNAKAKQQEELEKEELSKKKEDELRSKILSTLSPCKEQLTTMWSQQKNLAGKLAENKTTNVEEEEKRKEKDKEKLKDKERLKKKEKLKVKEIPRIVSTSVENNVDDGKTKKGKKVSKHSKNNTNNIKVTETSQSKVSNKDQKLNKIYKELKCTVKGFDQLHDFIPNADESSLGKETTNSFDSDTNSSQSIEVAFTARPIGLRRRSSIHALSAIALQMRQQASDCSDCDLSQKAIDRNEPQRRSVSTFETNSSSDSCVSQDFPSSSSKRSRTIDEIIKPSKISKTLRITDDDTRTSSCSTDTDESSKHLKQNCITKQPIIKLKRISQEFIEKHTKRRGVEETNQSSRLKKSCERIANTDEPAQKLPKLKKYNNDCQMTERNTSFCVLCRSKPSDLTNHYITRHKTESYVARLDWSELDDLSMNTPFAKLQPKTRNYRLDRYEVECPFCKDKLVEQFINLHHHYSAHTGEYAFQCSSCHLTQPYRPDIQSHILHSKACRGATTTVLYRYPPNAQCIYLHFCTICNFVQLNEANVLKHLREHHHSSKAIASNVQKYILAAISDGPDLNEANKPPTPSPTPPPAQNETTAEVTESVIHEKIKSAAPACSSRDVANEVQQLTMTDLKFKVDDDDITVSNEPCLEEEFLEADKYSLEEQLKQLHEGPATSTNSQQAPMTVIHCFTPQSQLKSNPNSDRHLPMNIKAESLDVRENRIITLSRPPMYKTNEPSPNIAPESKINQSTIYEKYRSYPQNVNYLGLYKCMIGDCYYSTDCPEELCKHLTEHSSDESKSPFESLQCPYCDLSTEMSMSPKQLVDHVRDQHEHLIYQCSMCCYRSCDASNVRVHQQVAHNEGLDACKIYKCSDDDSKANNRLRQFEINEQNLKNIFKIVCTLCNSGFYHSQLLINHLNRAHNVHDVDGLKIYSCIYCNLMMGNKSKLRIHMAAKHPDELPCIYDHNTQCNSLNEDQKRRLDVVHLSESVAFEQIKYAASDSIKEDNTLLLDIKDIKPDLVQLLQMNEETTRARLGKLTEHTGVPPDKLYRCPEPICGGFFSVFGLWLRHMKVRHRCLECQCPHCPAPKLIALEKFALHFEEHRRHTFICFHCPLTFASETLACQHFNSNHSNLGAMRFEQVRFNLCYSYSIMLQSDLCKEREHFITEFMVSLDKRLKDLECNKIQKLKHQWPVQENALWIDDYLQMLYNRRVVRVCLMKNCSFRTLSEDNLFTHMRNSHIIKGTLYNCSKCKYSIELCNSFDEVFKHIKLHNEFISICTACSLSTSSRSKMSTHIKEQHSARDVPVIQLFTHNQQLYINIFIVFSDNHLTFSTMKNCFCCPEKNMEGDVFSLHLKRYHHFSFNYYCEMCPNFEFKSLKDVKPHFHQEHPTDRLKIQCVLASPNDLSVTSLNDFQVQISAEGQLPQMSSLLRIKDEPLDVSNTDNDRNNDVVLLEDDDIVIQESLRDERLQRPKEMPKLKCTSLQKLIEPSPSSSMKRNFVPLNHVLHQPSATRPEASLMQRNFIQMHQVPHQMRTNFVSTNQDVHQPSATSTMHETSAESLSTVQRNCLSLNHDFQQPPTSSSSVQRNFHSVNPVFGQPSMASTLTYSTSAQLSSSIQQNVLSVNQGFQQPPTSSSMQRSSHSVNPGLRQSSTAPSLHYSTSTEPSSIVQQNCQSMNQVFHQPSTSAACPVSRMEVSCCGNNNLGAFINNSNVSINHSNTLNSMDTATPPAQRTQLIYCNPYTSGHMPSHHTNQEISQTESLPSQSNSNTYRMHVPNNIWMDQALNDKL